MLEKPQGAAFPAASPAFAVVCFLPNRHLRPFFPMTPYAEDKQMFPLKGLRSPLEEFMPLIS